MTESTQPLSPSLKARRQALKSQRRLRVGQSAWRFLALLSLTGGLFWAMSLPYWLIQSQSQVMIEGNQLLSSQQVFRWLSLKYPLSFWQIPIPRLESMLERQSPIASVQITRQLFPPELQVHLQERKPVARAIVGKESGFLDEKGFFIPRSLYPQGEKFLEDPSVLVLGFDRLDASRWQRLFKLIHQSSVKIEVLDWRDPSNLVLKTELGMVLLGGESEQLPEQFRMLSQLRSLSSRVPRDRVNAIDLSNPKSPFLKLKPLPKPPISPKTE